MQFNPPSLTIKLFNECKTLDNKMDGLSTRVEFRGTF